MTSNPQDRLLFLGNRQETVPRRLLLARDLSPRDKFAWQLLRLHAHDVSSGLFPTYAELQCWLADRPEREKASRSTVSHALTMLRLTRWLSLCQRLRDARTGQITGNLYALHDEPLTFANACQMDAEYAALLTACAHHRNLRIRATAIALLLAQPVDSGRICTESSFGTGPGTQSVPGVNSPGPAIRPGDAERAGRRSRAACVLTATDLKTNNKRRTLNLRWPVDNPFSASERRAAERAMGGLDAELCQQVLDDCLLRLAHSDIRRPLAYLLAMLERARRGEFNRLRRRRRLP
ncbi:STY4528 family pathogenicity island replication protein [Salmonella bongori]